MNDLNAQFMRLLILLIIGAALIELKNINDSIDETNMTLEKIRTRM